MLFMVSHRERLGEPFSFIITAARADGVHVAPVFLGLRMHQRVTVNLGG